MKCKGIYWYLTYKCNLRCKHCWISCSPEMDTTNELGKDSIHKVIADIDELKPGTVALTGGEPLLHRSLYGIIRELAAKKISMEIETNGLLMTDRFVSTVASLNGHGASIGLNISLDGGNAVQHDWLRGKGTFDRLVSNLRRLANKGIPYDIQCIVNRLNIAGISGIFELCQDLDTRFLKFGTTFVFGRAADNASDLVLGFDAYRDLFGSIITQATHYPRKSIIIKTPPAAIAPDLLSEITHLSNVQIVSSCDFPMLGILPNGDITVCALTVDSPEVRLGNISTTSLKAVFRDQYFQRLAQMNSPERLRGICATCRFKAVCCGSCRAQAFDKFGSFDEAFPLCHAMHQQGRFYKAYQEVVHA